MFCLSFFSFTLKLLLIAELAFSSYVAVAEITVQQVVFLKMIVPVHSGKPRRFCVYRVKKMVN